MGCNDSRVTVDTSGTPPKKDSQKFQFDVYACLKECRLDKIKYFLENKFDIGYKMPTFNNSTVLHIAAEYCDTKIIAYLIEQGADINALDNSGCPPLFIAMKTGNMDVSRLLIDSQANINIVTSHGLSLHHFVNASKLKESHSVLKEAKYNKIKL